MDHEIALAEADDQPTAAWRSLSFRQQWGLGVAAIIVLVGLLWMVGSNSGSHLVVLPLEQPLTPETLRQLTADFRAAGLKDFELDAGTIRVPATQLSRYTALLPAAANTPENWASEWERQNDRLTPFSSSRARETTREIARAKLITGLLQKLPDVQHADVVWDEDARPGWRQSPQARATVYLMPRPDCVLTLDVIRSVRLAVAGSKKNLDPTDVVVMDLARQVTYEGELPALAGEELLLAVRSLAELYRREIQQQVDELQQADVDVRIDLPRFFAFLAEHPADAEHQLSAAAPGLLRVAVTVPAGSGLSSSERTQHGLRHRIAELTGIGAGDGAQSVSFAFEPSPVPANDHTLPFSLAAQLPQFTTRQLVPLFSGVTLIGLALLWGRGARQPTPRQASSAFPPLQDLGQRSAPDGEPVLSQFDDLSHCDNSLLRSAYSHATPRRWAVALRGSTIDVREHLVAALDPPDADELRRHCEELGPVTLADIDASRQRIIESIHLADGPE